MGHRVNLAVAQPMVAQLPIGHVHGAAKRALRDSLTLALLSHALVEAIVEGEAEFSERPRWIDRDETIR